MNMVEHEIQTAGGTLGVERSFTDGVAVWTITRPDRRNALSRSVVRELGRLARQDGQDPSVRVIVLTATGTEAFCAGADLKERLQMSEEEVRDFLPMYRSAFGSIDACPKPVVAMMNGSAFGGGLELALACDFRVAASHIEVGLTETSLGIIPGAGGTQRLTHLLGPHHAKEMILFSKRIKAAEAQRLGILHQVFEGDLWIQTQAYIDPLRTGAPIALSAALFAIDAAINHDLETGISKEREAYERVLVSNDRVEALKAFQEKRKPVFVGK